jgi:hypothetical protein
MSQPPHGPGRSNQTSFRRGISGNPGGRPATGEISALARRYTADWLRGLVEVVRLPVCRENAPSIISAAVALRDTGYPGLTKAAPDTGPASLHLHLLAVTQEAQATQRLGATLQSLPTGPVVEGIAAGWADVHEPLAADRPLIEDAYLPPLDEAMPHEALPLWDAAAAAADGPQPAPPGTDDNENHAGEAPGETDDADAFGGPR